MERTGANLFRAPAETPQVMEEEAQVQQGMLEGSNVNSIQQMAELIDLSRSLESAEKLAQRTHQLERDGMQRLGTVQ